MHMIYLLHDLMAEIQADLPPLGGALPLQGKGLGGECGAVGGACAHLEAALGHGSQCSRGSLCKWLLPQ